MATLRVQPRRTPEERADVEVDVDVDDELAALAATLEDWSEPRPGWSFALREGHDFGRGNNVEVALLFASGGQSCTLAFRLDQLEGIDEIEYGALLRFEEQDGIAKTAMLSATSLDIQLFHILPHT